MHPNEKIIRDFFRAWQQKDLDAMSLLAEECTHTSPSGHFGNKKEFLDSCWEKLAGPYEMLNLRIYAGDGGGAISYETPVGEGRNMPICEWFGIENGRIRSIRVFWDQPQ